MYKSTLLTLLTILTISFSSFSQQVLTLGLNKVYHGVAPGYTLFAPLLNTDVYLIDNCGQLVHQWDSGTRLLGNSVYLLENGQLLKTSKDVPLPATAIPGGGGGQYVELVDWDGNIVWEYEYFDSATVRMHHDVEMLPNGNVLILAWDLHNYSDCINSGRNPNQLPDSAIWSEHIIEVDPTTDQIVWEWWLWDHLVQDFDNTKNNYGVIADHPELMDINFHGLVVLPGLNDWIHANSIDYNANLDQIVMNSRHTGEFYIIDHSTTTQEAASHSGGNSGKGGDFLYRWGNPMAYGHGISGDTKLFGAHDVHWMEDSIEGANKLLIFNNGWQRQDTMDWSDVIALDLPWNDQNSSYDYSSGVAFGPTDHYWQYKDQQSMLSHGTVFYSGYISGAQRLGNGNTLICDGAYGRLFEITPNDEIVWEYYSPIVQGAILDQGDTLQPFALGTINPVFRALKYDPSFPGLVGKNLTPGDPIEGNFPVPYECAGFASLENAGDLNQISLFPNPTNRKVEIQLSGLNGDIALQVFGVTGNLVEERSVSGDSVFVDLSSYENGIYLFHFKSDTYTKTIRVLKN